MYQNFFWISLQLSLQRKNFSLGLLIKPIMFTLLLCESILTGHTQNIGWDGWMEWALNLRPLACGWNIYQWINTLILIYSLHWLCVFTYFMFSGGQTIILEGARLDVIQNPKIFFSTKSPLKPARFEVVSVCHSNLKKKIYKLLVRDFKPGCKTVSIYHDFSRYRTKYKHHLMLLSVIWFQQN